MRNRTASEKRELVRKVNKKKKNTDLPVKEICSSLGFSDASYYTWRKQFDSQGEVQDESSDPAEAKIVALKQKHPYYGIIKIQKQLERFHGLHVKRSTVEKTLQKHGLKETSNAKSRRKKGTRRFERIDSGELWQMDIMYYTLKEAGRFYLISVLDDHSRFICAHLVSTTQRVEKILDTLKMAVEKHGRPQQILTDRGSQFHAWQGISQFDRTLEKMGIEHILTSPQSPQTIGKIESWHRNIQRELLRQKEFGTVKAAREAIADYVDYYNHQRVHMGIDYLTPADRFFGVAEDIKKLMDTTRDNSFYLTARIDGQPVRVEPGEEELVVKLSGEPVKNISRDELRTLLL